MSKLKRALTLDDLYSYFEANKLQNFSAEKEGFRIAVLIPGSFSMDEEEDNKGLLPVHLKACHTGLNRNNSYISEEVMRKALPSLKNRPILGDVVQLEDGSYDFYSHDFVIEKDGSVLYQEKPIGVTTDVENARLEYDKEADKTYVLVDGVIYEEYGNQAADIIRRKNGTKVSVEISISDLSFNAEEKYLEINDFYFSGITCLGTNPDTGDAIEEGMEGARLDLKDFSAESAEKKGGIQMAEEKEIMEEETPTEETVSEEAPAEEETYATFSIGDHVVRRKISMNEKIETLMGLVNDTYPQEDDFYTVDVYDTYVIMIQVWGKEAYKQDYVDEEGVIRLVGDRKEVHARYLTPEEEDALAQMETERDTLRIYKENAEAEKLNAAREAVLSDEKYAVLADNERFTLLRKEAGNYSAEDLALHANAILGEYYSAFAAKGSVKKVGIEDTAKPVGEVNPYGNLFK